MDTAIAWLGLGSMGAPMARRMLDAGHQIHVWNRSPQRAQPLGDAGAVVARSPAVAAEGADVVFVMLSDVAGVEAVVFGDNGVLAGLRPGGVIVQMSTIGPRAIRELAGRLPRGIEMVDAPVAGSTPLATSGGLLILAGGNATTLDRVEPLLAPLGHVRRCGELGHGSAMKLVVNTGLLTAVAALADALTLADGVGVSREVALEAMKAGALGGVVGRVTGTAQFAITLAAKDLRLATEASGLPLPVAEGAAKRMNDAITAGIGDKDIAAIV